MKRIIMFGFFVFLHPVYAWGGEEADAYERLFTEVCILWKAPRPLALAIARQESGLNPWAVNIEGRGRICKSQEEALTLIDQAWRQGRSFDVGLMQINSYWMKRYGLDPHLLLDPRNNVIMGVWILSREIERFGLTWRAVAGYHTPVDRNPERGKKYALSVIRQIKKMSEGAEKRR